MAHALPPTPRRRRARFPVTTVVLVVLAFAVGLIVGARHSRSNGASHTGSTASRAAADTTTLTTGTSTTGTSTSASTAPSTSPVPPSTTTTSPTAPGSKPNTPKTTTPASTPSSVPKVGIVVANNTARNGLAATARSRFESAGWTVIDVTNFYGGVLSTCAYYSPSDPANQRAAELLRQEFPAIKRIEPRFSRLPSSPIVVILTSDYR